MSMGGFANANSNFSLCGQHRVWLGHIFMCFSFVEIWD